VLALNSFASAGYIVAERRRRYDWLRRRSAGRSQIICDVGSEDAALGPHDDGSPVRLGGKESMQLALEAVHALVSADGNRCVLVLLPTTLPGSKGHLSVGSLVGRRYSEVLKARGNSVRGIDAQRTG